jgi:hypothetical protein
MQSTALTEDIALAVRDKAASSEKDPGVADECTADLPDLRLILFLLHLIFDEGCRGYYFFAYLPIFLTSSLSLDVEELHLEPLTNGCG